MGKKKNKKKLSSPSKGSPGEKDQSLVSSPANESAQSALNQMSKEPEDQVQLASPTPATGDGPSALSVTHASEEPCPKSEAEHLADFDNESNHQNSPTDELQALDNSEEALVESDEGMEVSVEDPLTCPSCPAQSIESPIEFIDDDEATCSLSAASPLLSLIPEPPPFPSEGDDDDEEDEVDDGGRHRRSDRMTGGKGGKRNRQKLSSDQQSVSEDPFSDEDITDYLLDRNEPAEARLAARRQARAEARDIRMKELEKQQKESDDNADRHYDMYTSPATAPPTDVVNRAAFRVALGSHRTSGHSVGSASYHSSRRSSEDSSEDGIVNMRDLRHELKELEDKFRKSMVQTAQLDNEKSALTYQVELLKDRIEDLEEMLSLLQREHRDKCRDFENLKRLSNQVKEELEYCKSQLQERDELIKEYGLVLVENEVEVDLGNGEKEIRIKRALVTQQTAQVLSTLGDGSLDVRLKKVLEEKNELLDEIRRLKLDLEEERSKNFKGGSGGGLSNNVSSGSNHLTNGPESEVESSKLMADYKFKTQKYEQEIAALQANVARLDTQVQRFKCAAEEAESREDDLKVERRKLQRELREAQSKLDELETTNSHLQKRLDKLKTAKSTLLKEL